MSTRKPVSKLAPELLGAIAVAAYSYMALVPLIQPPIMRALTTDAERKIKMSTLRKVSKLEKIIATALREYIRNRKISFFNAFCRHNISNTIPTMFNASIDLKVSKNI